MPLHGWTRVPAGLFHHFHQDWSIEIARTLNRGMLPDGLSALVEQRSEPKEADVLAIESFYRQTEVASREAAAVALQEPQAKIVKRSSNEIYATRANRIVIRHHLGRIVSVIEILSPGNKDSSAAIRDLVDKTIDFLRTGVHVLLVDVFPPNSRNPSGIHKVVWDEIDEEDFRLSPDADRMAVSYQRADETVAYLNPFGVGDPLPAAPVFLPGDLFVMLELEQTYQATWDAAPQSLRAAVETGEMPNPDAFE